MSTHVIAPVWGKILTLVIAALAVLSLVSVALGPQPADVVRVAPSVVLITVATWAIYWRPFVRLDDSGITVRNVLRTFTVPWGAVREVETRFAFTLVTESGRIVAWAAPAPGRLAAMRVARDDLRHLPAGSHADGMARPGDSAGSDSGAAAYLARTELARRAELGIPAESARVERHWHLGTIAAFVVFGGAAILATTLA
ncbi:PH domain-containing protein [uncultured Schumannella sp.]|uniref:PH domain-containing protein n=1 Tax=uncultured Schumannella sp. TaxID=1195956 RepID=UPI0025D87E4B|nr:PH domain-containing protein [uncultured Schumannella sp.]